MKTKRNFEQSEIAIIGRGIESIFRRLIRFVVGKISLVKLQEMISSLYVEELENKLREQHPKRQLTLAALALSSGLDIRTINKIRNSLFYRKSVVDATEFFRTFTPVANILYVWSTDTKFLNKDDGLPKSLTITGENSELEQLLLELTLPRGITTKGIIHQLKINGLVEIDIEKGLIRMLLERYLPMPENDRGTELEVEFSAVSRLIDTVVHNIETRSTNNQRLFQKIYWAHRLPSHKLLELRTELNDKLKQVESEASASLKTHEQEFENPEQSTAGFGIYYFEKSNT